MKKIIALGAAFILGVGAGWIIQGRYWDVFLTSYIPALATLLAAFYGAKYAFQFQNDKELKDTNKRNLINTNAAIFSLSRMANKLYIYQRDIIEPARDKQVRFLELRPTLDIEKERVKLDIESLYFLLETDYRNLLSEVIIEEERYRSAIDDINTRSKIHLLEVQPLLEKSGLTAGGTYTIHEIEMLLGNRLYLMLQQSTEQIISNVDRTLVSLKQVSNKLRDGIKVLYPDEKVIHFTLPE